MCPFYCENPVKDVALAYLLQDSSVSVIVEQQPIAATVAAVASDAIDFGSVTVGLSAEQVAAHPNLDMYPFLVTAIVPIYRLDGFTSSGVQLVLSRLVLGYIYEGNITWWNDGRIQAINPTVALPNRQITVVFHNESLALVTTHSTDNLRWLVNRQLPPHLSIFVPAPLTVRCACCCVVVRCSEQYLHPRSLQVSIC